MKPPKKSMRKKRSVRPVTHFIKAHRKAKSLSIEKLALLANLSASMISQLERGTSGYTQDTLEALAKALKVTPGDLLERDPQKLGGLGVTFNGTHIVHDPDFSTGVPQAQLATLRVFIVHTMQACKQAATSLANVEANGVQ